jgi:SpoVK/Ycf46/Vps4 family AAA+-type ATPase
MEDFEGILIATTNLTTNLDKAFERRFLYKIRFEKPSIEARVKIWCDKIEGLSENDALRLATEFPLSGGQIENVAKKCLMKYVICNETPSLSELCEYSAEELMQQSQKRRIGYLN